jgi:hypothetical protein
VQKFGRKREKNMKVSDGAVDDAVMREAASSVSNFDTATAIAWMREREDTLGIYVQRQADRIINELVERQGVALTATSRSTIERAVIVTALTAASALMLGHYRLWRDLMRGTALASVDPLLAIRRRVDPRVSPLQPAAPGAKGSSRESILHGSGVPAQDNEEAGDGSVPATRLRFVRCQVGTPTDAPDKTLLAITSRRDDGSLRHQAVEAADAEELMRGLADSLARLGSERAAAVWPALCGGDAKFEPLPALAGSKPLSPPPKRGRGKRG